MSWLGRARRADSLAEDHPYAAEMLTFYARVLRWQAQLESPDPPQLAGLITVAREHGPAPLAAAATELEAAPARWGALLSSYWEGEAVTGPRRFFVRAFTQPLGAVVPLRRLDGPCPRCGGSPQAGVLTPAGEGAALSLLCARCLDRWRHPRIRCAGCGSADPATLKTHRAASLPHVAVTTCSACAAYTKVVDRTRNGHADPLVDDVATAPLDLWARAQGFSRPEPNLVGV